MQRILFFAIAAASASGLFALVAVSLAVGGWTLPKALLLACFVPVAPWLGVCVGNALSGFALLLGAAPAAAFPLRGDFEHGPITASCALAVTVRNEDLTVVLPPLLALRTALGERFVAWVLSDTQDPALAAREAAAVAGIGYATGGGRGIAAVPEEGNGPADRGVRFR